MMEEYEKHANEFADDDDMSFNANDDHANALENDLEKLIENVKSQAGRDMKIFVAMVDFMELPELIRFVSKKMPDVYCKIEKYEGQDPFERTVC